MKMSKSEKTYRGICFGVCTLIALVSFYPLLYSVFMSFATQQEIVDNGGFLLWFPTKPTLLGYQQILNSQSFVWQALVISFSRTIIGSLLHLVVTSLAGYALSRQGLPGKRIYMYFLLVPILFSGGLIPGYLVIKELGLINSFWVMILPGVFGAYNVLIFKQFFEAIPNELEQSAQVDGVNELGLFWYIILPMSKPVLASIGLFTVVGHWNSWFDAFLYIDQNNNALWPLQTYVMQIFNNLSNLTNPDLVKMLTQIAHGDGVNQLTTRMALTIVAMLPILIVYPFFQKYFTKGVYLGAVKG